MMSIFKDFGNRPLVIIRFNPDCYVSASDNKKHKSCFVCRQKTGKLEIRNPKEWDKRLKSLTEVIDKYCVEYKPKKELVIEHLYYS